MKASQLIEQLQTAIRQHGDLPVTVMDGLDPSDECAVERVALTTTRFFSSDPAGAGLECHKNVPHFYIV